mmetsp:Transcript_5791/g.10380  ORF Transcript_5791/g.10380 Transcript_5791/m.10380 type:complete len:216 (-) Transcript_5791:729-1376(-)
MRQLQQKSMQHQARAGGTPRVEGITKHRTLQVLCMNTDLMCPPSAHSNSNQRQVTNTGQAMEGSDGRLPLTRIAHHSVLVELRIATYGLSDNCQISCGAAFNNCEIDFVHMTRHESVDQLMLCTECLADQHHTCCILVQTLHKPQTHVILGRAPQGVGRVLIGRQLLFYMVCQCVHKGATPMVFVWVHNHTAWLVDGYQSVILMQDFDISGFCSY